MAYKNTDILISSLIPLSMIQFCQLFPKYAKFFSISEPLHMHFSAHPALTPPPPPYSPTVAPVQIIQNSVQISSSRNKLIRLV